MEQVQQPARDGLGWNWIHFVFSGIIALLMARYLLRVYQPTDSLKHYPAIKFNSWTLYPALYISADERTITNRPTPLTHRVTSDDSHLHRYTGVLLNKPLSVLKPMYIDIMISYRVFSGQGILFEIGFEEKEEIDKLLFLRDAWGTMYVRVATCNDVKDICLVASDGKMYHSTWKISNFAVDEWFDLRLGFNINPDDDSIEVMYSLSNKITPKTLIYKFVNADINENKWPVFATYNPHMFQVHMKLNNVKNMWFNPSTLHPMVYISEDNLELSNVATKTTSRLSFREGQFQKYEGVMANVSFDVDNARIRNWPSKVHFDVNLQYNITELLSENYLFEIGLSREKYIDKHWCVGPHRYAVSVFGAGCNKRKDVCLFALKDNKQITIGILSKSDIGTRFKSNVRLSIDFTRATLTVSVSSMIHVFNNVDLTEPMWPVFALYKHGVNSIMTLK